MHAWWRCYERAACRPTKRFIVPWQASTGKHTLSWGACGKSVELGAVGTADCTTCGKERTFKDVLVYRCANIWYVFRWVTRRTYMTVCEVCGRGTEHDRKRYEAEHGKSAIPLFDRLGGWILLGVTALLIVSVMVVGTTSGKRENALLKQPRVGDLYLAKVDTFSEGFEALIYRLLRVASVDGA